MSFSDKVTKFAVAMVIYVSLLLGCYAGYMKISDIDVVFYGALASMLPALLLLAFIIWLSPIGAAFNHFERTCIIAIALLGGYGWSVSVPTVIDRSLSFYILEKLVQRGGGISLDQFEYVFSEEFMREHKVVEVRLTEQQQSGTIVVSDGCVLITERGRRLAAFSTFFRRHFLPKRRLLMNEYSDDLIDPFERSDTSPDYQCK